MVTVAEEVQRALQLASVNNGPSVPPIIPAVTSSLCPPPPNPSDTSGPSMSPDCIGPLQMSPAFSVNSSHSSSNSLAKVKIEAQEVDELRGHQEGAGIGTGGNGGMVEKRKCCVQLERVKVVLKDTEQVQKRPGHVEETTPKKVGTHGELGLKRAKHNFGELGLKKAKHQSSGEEKVKCDECGKSLSKESLLNHKRVIHREVPFKCQVGDCDKRFSNKLKLADHKRVMHGFPKLRCKVEGCDSEFLLHSESESHYRAHKIMTECDECGERISVNHLSTHKKIVHKGEKPVCCQITGCDRSFQGTSQLKEHLRSAHGFAKLKCNFKDCSAEFCSRVGLSQHIRKHSN